MVKRFCRPKIHENVQKTTSASANRTVDSTTPTAGDS